MSDIITRDDLLNYSIGDNKSQILSGGNVDMHDFYTSLYDGVGGNSDLALKTKQYLEDNLANTTDAIKVKAKKFIFGKLSDYNDKLKGA